MNRNEELINKWKPLLEHSELPAIGNKEKLAVTATLLENTENNLSETRGHSVQLISEAGVPTNTTGAIDKYDPILITLVRRAAPQLIAYDLCGVQPMTGPTGLVFAMRARYNNPSGPEAFFNEANTAFATVNTGANTQGQKHVGTLPGGVAGNTVVSSNLAAQGIYNYGTGMSTSQAEALGAAANTAFPQMGFSIEKFAVEAKTRALKAEYSLELAQDMKAIHGLDAETELSNILSAEILSEINREVIRTINVVARPGAQDGVATPGVFDLDTDSNGRWSVERFKGLMFRLEQESNRVAIETRRGKANFVLTSSDVASALQMAGILDYTPALDRNSSLNVDDTGATFAGVLNGRMRVYIDPYALGGQYMTVGYKGPSNTDAGLFYCPYVPLQMVRAVGEDNFQPRIGFKTRYGMVANPFAEGLDQGLGRLVPDTNRYFRRVLVQNIA